MGSALLLAEVFVLRLGQKFFAAGDLANLEQPGFIGGFVDHLRRVEHGFVDGGDGTRHGREDVRDGLDALDVGDRCADLGLVALGREVHKYEIAELLLGVVGQADLRGLIVGKEDPFVAFGVEKFVRAHINFSFVSFIVNSAGIPAFRGQKWVETGGSPGRNGWISRLIPERGRGAPVSVRRALLLFHGKGQKRRRSGSRSHGGCWVGPFRDGYTKNVMNEKGHCITLRDETERPGAKASWRHTVRRTGAVPLRLGAFIERKRHDLSGDFPAAHVDLDRGSRFGVGDVEQRHRGGFCEEWKMGAGSGAADLSAVEVDRAVLPRDAPAGDKESDPLSCERAARFDRAFADEVGLLHLDGKVQARFERRDLVVHLVPVERHRRLKAQGVPRAEAAGDETFFASCIEQCVPELRSVGGFAVEFVAVLAGVAGLGDDAGDFGDLAFLDKRIVFFGDRGRVGELCEDVAGAGTLERDLRPVVRRILEQDRAREVIPHPGDVLLAVCGVDHDHEPFGVEPVDDEIVDDAPVFIAHRAVADLTVGHGGEVVGHQAVEVRQCVRAGKEDFAHVRDVEEAGLLTHRHVFGDHAGGVLDGEKIARERDDFPAERHMAVVKRRFEFHNRFPRF